jgi:hypothetical protein
VKVKLPGPKGQRFWLTAVLLKEEQTGQDAGCRVPGDGYWVLDTGYWILNTGCWMTDAGYWMQDAGFWMLDTGYWMPDI